MNHHTSKKVKIFQRPKTNKNWKLEGVSKCGSQPLPQALGDFPMAACTPEMWAEA